MKNFEKSLTFIKIIFAALILTIGLCSCAANNRLYISQPTDTKSSSAASSSKVISLNTEYSREAVQPQNTGDAHYTPQVVKSWEEYEASKFPLLAAIPDKKIYLYGIKDEGTILYYNDKGHFFNWSYLTPRFILPQMDLNDFDGDGKEELAVVLYVGSGTGYSVEELHIIEAGENAVLSDNPESKDYLVPNPEYFRDYSFTNYVEQLKKQVKLKTYKKGSSLMAEVTAGKKVYTLELDNPVNDIDNKNIVFSNIVRFEFKDKKLTGRFALGLVRKSYASPDFVGEITSEIQYNKGIFTLKNLNFESSGNK
ncbi:MAG: hypothetical protein K0R50_4226 [Eubacterium sp.]|jgi:hypothetical protein|nr:hypothetical protein [Eubacterium sp.]